MICIGKTKCTSEKGLLTPKALEQPTGLPNPQPTHEPPAQSPKPNPPSHSSQIPQKEKKRKTRGDREGTPRTAKLLKFNPQRHANQVY